MILLSLVFLLLLECFPFVCVSKVVWLFENVARLSVCTDMLSILHAGTVFVSCVLPLRVLVVDLLVSFCEEYTRNRHSLQNETKWGLVTDIPSCTLCDNSVTCHRPNGMWLVQRCKAVLMYRFFPCIYPHGRGHPTVHAFQVFWGFGREITWSLVCLW